MGRSTVCAFWKAKSSLIGVRWSGHDAGFERKMVEASNDGRFASKKM
jgi:hypothetical protein